jgi:hypothetical protein
MPSNDRVKDARALAARLRERELVRALPVTPLSYADPDARESVASSRRMIWPPDVVRTFARAHVLRFPRVRLYDDLPPEVSPARPRDKKGTV